MKRVTAVELEKQIFDIEKVRVIFRCKKNKRFDAEGFSDNIIGFPKGAEVESINEKD